MTILRFPTVNRVLTRSKHGATIGSYRFPIRRHARRYEKGIRTKSKYVINSILRATSVLKSYSSQELELGPSEVSRKNCISKAVAHRTLVSLAEGGLLEHNAQTGKYAIGPALYMLGSLYLSSKNLVQVASPVIKHMSELAKQVNVSISILVGSSVIIILREESTDSLNWAIHAGSALPAHAAASGKMLLSELSESEIDDLYPGNDLNPVTQRTIISKTKLKQELALVRSTGVAFSNEENIKGVVGIASIIRGANGKALAALSIGSLVYTLSDSKRELLAILARMASSLISYRLGFTDPGHPVPDINEIDEWWEKNLLFFQP